MVRVTIELAPEKQQEIEDLLSECGFSDKKDLINNAITMLGWAVKSLKSGCKVGTIDEENRQYTELQMPFMLRLRDAIS
jgi:hypothetical protein